MTASRSPLESVNVYSSSTASSWHAVISDSVDNLNHNRCSRVDATSAANDGSMCIHSTRKILSPSAHAKVSKDTAPKLFVLSVLDDSDGVGDFFDVCTCAKRPYTEGGDPSSPSPSANHNSNIDEDDESSSSFWTSVDCVSNSGLCRYKFAMVEASPACATRKETQDEFSLSRYSFSLQRVWTKKSKALSKSHT